MKHLIRLLKEEKGLTLLELLVVTGLLSVLLGTAYFFLYQTGLLAGKEFFRADVHNDLRLAANRISRDIRQAVEIQPAGQFTDSNWIAVKRVQLDTRGTNDTKDDREIMKEVKYSLDLEDREIEYAVRNELGFAGVNPIANHVLDLKFSRQADGTVVITITGEKDDTDKKEITTVPRQYDRDPYRFTVLTKVTPKMFRER